MKIGMTSAKHSVIDMSTPAYWNIRARLLRVPGVANIAIWGERLKMYQVQTDPGRLNANKVSLDKVMQVTADALDSGLLQFSAGGVHRYRRVRGNRESAAGRAERAAHRHPRRPRPGRSQRRDGRTLRLADVANVVEDHQPPIGDAVINDGPGLLLIVEKQPEGNTLEVTKGVEAALDELQPGLSRRRDRHHDLPARPRSSSRRIDNLRHALLVGCVLVVLILVAFLFDWRTALISLTAIPLSLVAAGVVLTASGATLNTMVLAGLVIALGEVVDDAIIDVENIVRRLRLNRRGGTAAIAASRSSSTPRSKSAARRLRQLIIVVVVLPIFFLDGLAGVVLPAAGLAYILAILASLLVALTVTPALSFMLLRNATGGHREAPLVRVLQAGYRAVLARPSHEPARRTSASSVLFVAVRPGRRPAAGRSTCSRLSRRPTS